MTRSCSSPRPDPQWSQININKRCEQLLCSVKWLDVDLSNDILPACSEHTFQILWWLVSCTSEAGVCLSEVAFICTNNGRQPPKDCVQPGHGFNLQWMKISTFNDETYLKKMLIPTNSQDPYKKISLVETTFPGRWLAAKLSWVSLSLPGVTPIGSWNPEPPKPLRIVKTWGLVYLEWLPSVARTPGFKLPQINAWSGSHRRTHTQPCNHNFIEGPGLPGVTPTGSQAPWASP